MKRKNGFENGLYAEDVLAPGVHVRVANVAFADNDELDLNMDVWMKNKGDEKE